LYEWLIRQKNKKKMQKNTKVAIINTLAAAGANVVDDTTAQSWNIIEDATDNEVIVGPVDYGKTTLQVFASQAEARHLTLLGASTSKETIVASTRYSIEIYDPMDYESEPIGGKVFAYTSAATLSGTAATDRATVYDALVTKINAYDGVNVTGYALTYAAYTLGTDNTGTETNFTIGEQVTQETSGETANVAKCTITSGTMATDDAAGNIWLYNLSSVSSWLSTAKTLTGGTSAIIVTVTNATTVHSTGIAILDDAGYFISKKNRKGATNSYVKAGFSTDTFENAITAAYARGIGSVMNTLKPVYDHTKQDMIEGDPEFEFEQGTLVDTSKTYSKYVFTITDGDEVALSSEKEATTHELILYVDESNSTNLTNFDTAVDTVVAK
jgi:hypothetical protein